MPRGSGIPGVDPDAARGRRDARCRSGLADIELAGLGGQAWVDFIRQKGDSSLLNEQIAAVLSRGRFQTRVEVDSQALYELGQSWINSLYQHNHRTTHEAVPLEGSTK